MDISVKGLPPWNGVPKNIFIIISCFFTLLVLYWGYFGVPINFIHRSSCLVLGLVLGFMLYPSRIFKQQSIPESVLNILLITISIGSYIWTILSYERIEMSVKLTSCDLLWGSILALLVLELTRRAVSTPLAVVGGIALLYAYFGSYLPGIFAHRGYNLERIIAVVSTGGEGILSSVLGIVAALIFLFLIFGAFMNATNASKNFMDIASFLAGKSYGGPAKVAVIASGFMAMVSGSSVANVATTGAATIPAMKAIGYPPHVAGAIEAVASSGGQKTPPLMGASAFIMADLLGLPYLKICLCALIPSILHYVSLYSQVHYTAKNLNLRGTVEVGRRIMSVVLDCLHLFIGFVILVTLLLMQYTAGYAVIYAIIALVFFSFFNKNSRMNFERFISALVGGARQSMPLIGAGATAGLVLGILSLTGLGAKLSEAIEYFSYGNAVLALVVTMIVSLLLGMGLPTLVCYLILAVLVAPILHQLGFSLLASHFFIFYYGVLSSLTPPMCLASFTAASIAGAPMMKTGFTAVRYGVVLYILPFAFMYNPDILFEGTIYSALLKGTLALFGAWGLGIAAEGYYASKLNWFLRMIIGISSFLLIMFVNEKVSLLAFLAIVAVFLYERRQRRNSFSSTSKLT